MLKKTAIKLGSRSTHHKLICPQQNCEQKREEETMGDRFY
jgi:hypothetical protein